MDAAELRATQAPIKERYKTDPKAAFITLKAKGSIENEGIACKVETGRALAVAGPASGDRRLRARIVLRRHAAGGAGRLRRRDPEIGGDRDRGAAEDGNVIAEGDLDFRGTLGVDKEAPVGFAEIRLRFDVETDGAAGQARPAA